MQKVGHLEQKHRKFDNFPSRLSDLCQKYVYFRHPKSAKKNPFGDHCHILSATPDIRMGPILFIVNATEHYGIFIVEYAGYHVP